MLCSVDECPNPSRKRGWCQTHYSRWRKHGDTSTVAKPPLHIGEDHWRWSGGGATYQAVHFRLKKARGRAADYDCVDCGNAAKHWSYDKSDEDQVFGMLDGYEVAYSLDLGHYEPRCIPCHLRLDQAERIYA